MEKQKKKRKSLYLFSLGGKEFTSKSALTKFYRNIVKDFKSTGKRVYKLEKQHESFEFVKDLFLRHPKARKSELIERFEFKQNTQYGSNWCGWVVYDNEKKESFGLKQCIEGSYKHYRKSFALEAMRNTITHQTLAFKKKYPNIVECNSCNKTLLNVYQGVKASNLNNIEEKAQVDHDVTHGMSFSEIAKQFKEENKHLKLTCTKRNLYIYGKVRPGYVFKDEKTTKAWQNFHKEKTIFRFLCATCNTKSENIPKGVKRVKIK